MGVKARLRAIILGTISIVAPAQAAEGQDPFATVFNLPPDPAPLSIGSNTQLNVHPEGHLPSGPPTPFHAGRFGGSDVNIEVNVLGGTVGTGMVANAGSRVTVSSGSVGPFFDANFGSEVVVTGGSIDSNFSANNGSRIEISGGLVGSRFFADQGSQVTISGGSIGRHFFARSGSHVHLVGLEFLLEGVELFGPVTAPQSMILPDRGGRLLTGLLLDGSPFDFILNDVFGPGEFFSPSMTLRLTQHPFLRGDYDANGQVDQGDLDLVLLNWGDQLNDPVVEGWKSDPPINIVDQRELDRVLLHWGNTLAGTNSVPEAATCGLAFVLLAVCGCAWLKRP